MLEINSSWLLNLFIVIQLSSCSLQPKDIVDKSNEFELSFTVLHSTPVVMTGSGMDRLSIKEKVVLPHINRIINSCKFISYSGNFTIPEILLTNLKTRKAILIDINKNIIVDDNILCRSNVVLNKIIKEIFLNSKNIHFSHNEVAEPYIKAAGLYRDE